jgi:hypothetical protein
MFKELFKLEKERTKKEAAGFFLTYWLLLSLFNGIVAMIFGLVTMSAPIGAGSYIGTMTAVILSPALYFVVLFKKHWLGNYGLIVLGLTTPVLALLAGYLLGLIPVAYLTTLRIKNSEEDIEIRE